jgi:predicted MFS family arabinose efflux permease
MNNKSSRTNSHNCLSYQDNYDDLKLLKTRRKSEKTLSKKIRWMIFLVFFLTNALCNLDHGSIPACITEIQQYLNADKNTIGLLGSLVFLGNFFGSIFSLTIINYINRKVLLLCSLILNAICLYTFTVTKHYWLLFLNRICCGICQVYMA